MVAMKAFIVLASLALAAQIPTAALAAPEPLPRESGDLCRAAVSRQERAHGVPDQLLSAISMVESGRWDEKKRAGIAWPWTVTSGGNGNFFPTKAAAIAEVRRLQAKGVRNIDVGCMQVNLKYHPKAFASLEEAFDPTSNAAYAADFLSRLYDGAGSWLEAAAAYHSVEPKEGDYYRRKVVRAWSESKRAQVAAPTEDGDAELIPASYTQPAPSRGRRETAPLTPPTTPPTNEQLMQATIASHAVQAARTLAEREAARAFALNWRAERMREYESLKAQKRVERTAQSPERRL